MLKNRISKISLKPGQVVKELRNKKEWSQATLSHITGIAISNLSNIESGRSALGPDRAILIAEAFGVKPEFILFPNGYEKDSLKEKIRLVKKRVKLMERNEVNA